jgi:hypothetical protein
MFSLCLKLATAFDELAISNRHMNTDCVLPPIYCRNVTEMTACVHQFESYATGLLAYKILVSSPRLPEDQGCDEAFIIQVEG